MAYMKLTKELAERIFEAGGDWRMLCHRYTENEIDKIEWSEGIDFEDLWDEITKG